MTHIASATPDLRFTFPLNEPIVGRMARLSWATGIRNIGACLQCFDIVRQASWGRGILVGKKKFHFKQTQSIPSETDGTSNQTGGDHVRDIKTCRLNKSEQKRRERDGTETTDITYMDITNSTSETSATTIRREQRALPQSDNWSDKQRR